MPVWYNVWGFDNAQQLPRSSTPCTLAGSVLVKLKGKRSKEVALVKWHSRTSLDLPPSKVMTFM